VKLQFESDLDFQSDAIEAVCDLFRGQEMCRTEFTVTKQVEDGQLFDPAGGLGFGNRLTLLDEEILSNLNAVQLRNGLAPTPVLESADFTVEMETGTGKTYVYLRTIHELFQRFGFAKFVVVVPSVAIKEGVYKNLQITEDHFRALYAGTTCDYFQYDSAKLGQVRNFATSSRIQIMVTTVAAINKTTNVVYQESEKTGGERPIDLIRATNPIVIVDEPQSVDGGLQGKGKEALDAMAPLCTVRYSATHANRYHMVFRLDAVDAYERKLVKQIEVAAATVEGDHNKPYVRFVSPVARGKSVVGAKVELDVEGATGVQRRVVTVQSGDDLEETTSRAVYSGVSIGEIRAAAGDEFLELRSPGSERYLRRGEALGGVDPMALQREQINRTIREHFDKERRLRPQGIKVLSLFFIDAVEQYRQLDDDGNRVPGPLVSIFEEEYGRLARHPDYLTLFEGVDVEHHAREVHDGYFSIDKKGGWIDTSESNAGGRENAERAYNLIMKDKELLLSLDTPLKFIFSHSALREGWDNPNVFQICALREMHTERQRRQTIGRGLRLCVNQDGERLRGFDINTLTVIATESYEQFAENLQKEIEKETGVRFGIVEPHQFAAIVVSVDEGVPTLLGAEGSQVLWDHLKATEYIDPHGKVQDALRTALKGGVLEVPDAFVDQLPAITAMLRKVVGRVEVRSADERRTIKVNKEVLLGEEFAALWDRIKHKTTYRLEFDAEKLIADCTEALRKGPAIAASRLQWRKAGIAIGKAGVEATEIASSAPVVLKETDIVLPDALTELQDRTQLTRRSIARILKESGRLPDFKRNPQRFIDIAAEAINRRKQLAIVEGIKYQRIGDASYYGVELFEQQELTGYIKNLVEDQKRSVYEQVVCDFGVERAFAEELKISEAVKVYAKLPGWFTIPTPLGSYNPDWAVLVETDEGERLYFVVETKSTPFIEALREAEQAKIKCGAAHFDASGAPGPTAAFVVAPTLHDVLADGA